MRARIVIVLVVAAITIAACDKGTQAPATNPSPRPAATYQLPSSIKYTYNWAASSGIDLTAPPSIVTRAVIESMDITSTTDMRSGYPGYAQFAADQPQLDFSQYPGKIRDLTGTYYASIVRLDQGQDGTWHAGVCSWAGATAFEDGRQYTNKLGVAMLYPQPMSFDLRATTESDQSKTAPGFGPARAPSANVFKGWSLSNFELVSTSDRQTCDDLTPSRLPAQFQSHEPQRFDRPPPVLPPIPGWPDSN